MYAFRSSELLGKRQPQQWNCPPSQMVPFQSNESFLPFSENDTFSQNDQTGPSEGENLPIQKILDVLKKLQDESKILAGNIASMKLLQEQTLEQLISTNNLVLKSIKQKKKTSKKNYTPFFIKESYTGIDNDTNILSDKIIIRLNVLGNFDENPQIYPFGFNNIKSLHPTLKEQIVNLVILDSNENYYADATGFLRKNHQDLYIIDNIKVKNSDSDSSPLGELDLPFSIKCEIPL